MVLQRGIVGEPSIAVLAAVTLLPRVCQDVAFQVRVTVKPCVADLTAEPFLACVDDDVLLEIRDMSETGIAHFTRKWLLTCVSSHVTFERRLGRANQPANVAVQRCVLHRNIHYPVLVGQADTDELQTEKKKKIVEIKRSKEVIKKYYLTTYRINGNV